MTKVITKSGSEYTFFSKDGKTYLKHYNPAKSSHIAAIENVAVTYSELPIEPGYPLMLTLENGQTLRSTVIVSVDLEATAKTKAP